MSRTIRRKGAYNRSYFVNPTREIDEFDLARWEVSTKEECRARISAWFHSDNHCGAWNVPRWYRSERNKKFKRQSSEEMHRCWVAQNWEDHLPIRYMKDAGWFWW